MGKKSQIGLQPGGNAARIVVTAREGHRMYEATYKNLDTLAVWNVTVSKLPEGSIRWESPPAIPDEMLPVVRNTIRRYAVYHQHRWSEMLFNKLTSEENEVLCQKFQRAERQILRIRSFLVRLREYNREYMYMDMFNEIIELNAELTHGMTLIEDKPRLPAWTPAEETARAMAESQAQQADEALNAKGS